VATSIIDGAQVAQMLIAVGGVGAALRWGLPWAIKKFGRRTGGASGSAITVSGSASLGAAMVHILEIEGRRMLVGTTAQSVCLIAELGAESSPGEPADAFFDHLDAAIATADLGESAPEPKSRIKVNRYAVAPMAPEPAPAPHLQPGPREQAAASASRITDPDEAALEALRRLDQLFGPDGSR
jgi:flagellar biogenesis protein FliO